MGLKRIIKKKLLGYRYDSESFVSYLKSIGVKVGESVKIFSPQTTTIDITRPYLLEIGDSVKITANVTILTHDYSYSVLRIKYHDLLNECSGVTRIGNNVFIGIGSIIMPGVSIGDNCVIGSGSVVTKDIPSNTVAAGNPSHVICELDDFYKKRKSNQIRDAFRLVSCYREANGRDPTIKEMGSFFPLFLPRDRSLLSQFGVFTNLSGDNETEIINDWLNTEPAFDSFEDFLEQSKHYKYEGEELK